MYEYCVAILLKRPIARHRPRDVSLRIDMPLDPLNIAPLTDAQNRFRREFIDFARLWQEAKEDWRDDRAKQFEQEHLSPLGPSLSRFTSTLAEFTETLRKSQSAIADTGQNSGELY